MKTFGHPKLKPPVVDDQRVLAPRDLAAKGIHYSPSHLRKLIIKKRFPAPIKLSARKHVWSEQAINKWLADKIEGSAA